MIKHIKWYQTVVSLASEI